MATDSSTGLEAYFIPEPTMQTTTITIPGRWTPGQQVENQRAELQRLATILHRGADALCGCYMRMCDVIRNGGMTDAEVRETLRPCFSEPRISEIIRVSRAPREVYIRYNAGFFGFKAAIRECRGYRVTATDDLRRRKMRRAAERLVLLAGDTSRISVRDRIVTIERA